jgi:hypothetical protein
MYVKALVRRGEANEKLEHFEEAIAGEFKFYSIGQRIMPMSSQVFTS